MQAKLVTGPSHAQFFKLELDGTFLYRPDDATFTGSDTFSYVASDSTGDSLPTLVKIVTRQSATDADGDGVPDSMEILASYWGDGNHDGGLDYLQPNVVSLRGADHREWTLVASAGNFAWGSKLERTLVIANGMIEGAFLPLPPLPAGVLLASPLFDFRVRDLAPGQSTVVAITPGGLLTDRFYEFNPAATSQPGTPYWSDFPTDLAQGIRAVVSAEQIALHLVDGKAGDLDAKRDGMVTVLGGTPRFGASEPLANNLVIDLERHQSAALPITGTVTATGQSLVYAKVLGSEVGGTVDFDPATQAFVFRPNGTMVSVPQGARGGFVFQVTDLEGATAFGSVVITVPNTPPIAIDQEKTSYITQASPIESSDVGGRVQQDNPNLVFPFYLDADGDSVTAVLITPPRRGRVQLNGDGFFRYAPPPGLFGTDQFAYRLSDGFVQSTTADANGVPDRELAFVTINQSFGLAIPRSNSYTVTNPDNEHDLITLAPETLLANDSFSSGLAAKDYFSAVSVKVEGNGLGSDVELCSSLLLGGADCGQTERIYSAAGPIVMRADVGFRGTVELSYRFYYPFPTNSAFTVLSDYKATVFLKFTGSPESDVDGVPDAVEAAAGDLDGNGIEDWRQSNIASLPAVSGAYAGAYVGIRTTTETRPFNVQAVDPQSSIPPPPPGASFLAGTFAFQVTGLGRGEETTLTLFLPPGASPNTYYKLGVERDDPTDPADDWKSERHWYEFLFDAEACAAYRAAADPTALGLKADACTGAETRAQNPLLPENQIVLHFIDGRRGDDLHGDEHQVDGVITDPAGPALVVNRAPSFLTGGDQSANDESGPVQIVAWAKNISTGPGSEALQWRRFDVVSNTNPGLFASPPAIAANGTLTYTPRPNVSGSATITIQLVDGGGTAGGGSDTSGPQSFTVSVTKPHPWHNAARAEDVSGDTIVAPGDALLIINHINALSAARRSGEIPPDAPLGGPFTGLVAYVDVDRDNYVAPGDALLVINWINADRAAKLGQPGGGEGEWPGIGEAQAADSPSDEQPEQQPRAVAVTSTTDSRRFYDLLALLAIDTDLAAQRRRR